MTAISAKFGTELKHLISIIAEGAKFIYILKIQHGGIHIEFRKM